MRTGPLWDEHIIGALMSYWVYQHIGNLRPRDLDDDELFERVHEVDDAGPDPARLRDEGRPRARRHALELLPRPGRHPAGGDRLTRGPGARPGRPLDARPGGVGVAGGDGHRRLRPPAAGHLAALAARCPRCTTWRPGTRRCATAPGASPPPGRARRCARPSTWSTGRPSASRSRAWASSSARWAPASAATPPATILTLSGDVHHAYLAEVGYPRGAGVQSAIYQAVCSPFRNPLEPEGAPGDPLDDEPGDEGPRPLRCAAPQACPNPEVALAPGGRRAVVRQPVRDAHDRRPQPDRAPGQGAWATARPTR